MKKYIYGKKFYNFRVLFVGYFCIAILAWSIYRLIVSEQRTLWAFCALISAYQIFNTFISLSNPEEVDIDDHRITFKGLGKQHSYDFRQIVDFRVKEFPSTHKIYLRINKNDNSMLKGRYWIDCSYFNDGLELFQFLMDKEDEIHPDTVKAYAHRSNKFSPEEKEEIERRRQERREKSIFYRKKKKKGE